MELGRVRARSPSEESELRPSSRTIPGPSGTRGDHSSQHARVAAGGGRASGSDCFGLCRALSMVGGAARRPNKRWQPMLWRMRCAPNSPRRTPIPIHQPPRLSPHPFPRGACAVPPAVTSCNIKPHSCLSGVPRHEPSCAVTAPTLIWSLGRVELNCVAQPRAPTHRRMPSTRHRLSRTLSSATLVRQAIRTLALAHHAFGTYNVPQWHAVARYVACGAWPKSQSVNPPRPA